MKKGNIKAKAEGANVAAFISSAANSGIELRQIETCEKSLTFECSEKEEVRLKRIAASKGMLFEVVGRKNVKTSGKAFLRHVGAWSALLVIAATFAISRFFVFSVAVEGVTPARAEEISSALSEAGLNRIMPKSDVDLDFVERTVAGISDDIAFAEAYIDGVRLVINVKEQIPAPVQNEEKGKIVAACDAIVTRVEVEGGTAVVKAGDTVRKGQTLIEDRIIVGDPLDPEHKEIETDADGDVYGRVWYTQRLIIPFFREITVRTGRKYTSTALYLKDRQLLPSKQDHGFSQWEEVTEVKEMNSVLPFRFVTTTYYETTTSTAEIDEAYIESEAYAAFSSLFASLDPTAKVLGSYKSQKKVDNYYIIILYYEVEQLIGCREA